LPRASAPARHDDLALAGRVPRDRGGAIWKDAEQAWQISDLVLIAPNRRRIASTFFVIDTLFVIDTVGGSFAEIGVCRKATSCPRLYDTRGTGPQPPGESEARRIGK
jgi:hypothetical protein